MLKKTKFFDDREFFFELIYFLFLLYRLKLEPYMNHLLIIKENMYFIRENFHLNYIHLGNNYVLSYEL